MDREAWQATVHGVTKSQTQQKWLSTALLPFELQGQTCLLFRVSLRKKRKLPFLVLVLEDVVGLHRTGELQLLQHQWLGHSLGLLWC